MLLLRALSTPPSVAVSPPTATSLDSPRYALQIFNPSPIASSTAVCISAWQMCVFTVATPIALCECISNVCNVRGKIAEWND